MSFRVLVECEDVPFPARQAFGTANKPEDADENLWREVAARVALDACGYTNFSKADKGEYREHLKAMGEAHQWFLYDLDDVEEVFGLAGVEHEPVVAAVRELIDTKDLFHEPTDAS